MAKSIKDLKALSVLRGCAGYRHSGPTDLKSTRDVFSVARTMARDRPSPYDEGGTFCCRCPGRRAALLHRDQEVSPTVLHRDRAVSPTGRIVLGRRDILVPIRWASKPGGLSYWDIACIEDGTARRQKKSRPGGLSYREYIEI